MNPSLVKYCLNNPKTSPTYLKHDIQIRHTTMSLDIELCGDIHIFTPKLSQLRMIFDKRVKILRDWLVDNEQLLKLNGVNHLRVEVDDHHVYIIDAIAVTGKDADFVSKESPIIFDGILTSSQYDLLDKALKIPTDTNIRYFLQSISGGNCQDTSCTIILKTSNEQSIFDLYSDIKTIYPREDELNKELQECFDMWNDARSFTTLNDIIDCFEKLIDNPTTLSKLNYIAGQLPQSDIYVNEDALSENLAKKCRLNRSSFTTLFEKYLFSTLEQHPNITEHQDFDSMTLKVFKDASSSFSGSWPLESKVHPDLVKTLLNITDKDFKNYVTFLDIVNDGSKAQYNIKELQQKLKGCTIYNLDICNVINKSVGEVDNVAWYVDKSFAVVILLIVFNSIIANSIDMLTVSTSTIKKQLYNAAKDSVLSLYNEIQNIKTI